MFKQIEEKVTAACIRAGRTKDDVLLLAVSKHQPLENIREMYRRGLRDFGENRVQELLKKRDELPADIRWHFIGHLQTNKAKFLVPFITSVHSVDSWGLAAELSKRAGERAIQVLIEVNISHESQKNGTAPNEAEDLVTGIAERCPHLIVTGLMGMASFEENPEHTRAQFRLLRELRDRIRERHPNLIHFKELSMGMSNDFEVAIEEGATIVRIGSALFRDAS